MGTNDGSDSSKYLAGTPSKDAARHLLSGMIAGFMCKVRPTNRTSLCTEAPCRQTKRSLAELSTRAARQSFEYPFDTIKVLEQTGGARFNGRASPWRVLATSRVAHLSHPIGRSARMNTIADALRRPYRLRTPNNQGAGGPLTVPGRHACVPPPPYPRAFVCSVTPHNNSSPLLLPSGGRA